MKNRILFLMMVAALLTAFTARAGAQSLGDAARIEAERRAKLAKEKDAVKVYTNDDMKGPAIQRAVPDAPGTKPAVPAETPAADAPAKTAEPAAPKVAEVAGTTGAANVRVKRDEEHWRERAKVIRDRLDRLRGNAAVIEDRIASLQTELQSAPASRAGMLTSEITEATQALSRFQKELRLIQDEWNSFQERAEKAKVNPSWIHGRN